MKSFFTADFFINNRKRLRDLVGGETIIVLTASGNIQRSGDQPYPFRQDSNFWYLTGLDVADLLLVIGPRGDYLIVPGLSAERQIFDGGHAVDVYAATSGIPECLDEAAGWRRLKKELGHGGQVATLGSVPTYVKRSGMYGAPHRRRLVQRLKRSAPGVGLRDIRAELASMRSIKQAAELAALQRAIDVTSDTLRTIVESPSFPSLRMEYDIEAELSAGFRKRGAGGHAFPPIVAAGPHATTLHYLANNGMLGDGMFVVLDVGAEVEHYSADITRTAVVRGTPTKRQLAVFRAVADVQDFALSLIKPGVLARGYEQSVEEYMGTKLQELGLVRNATHQDIRRYFPHSTSHFLGLDTHDVGNYQQPWQENMVITCEPGIYIPEEGIGVRIEDDVLITASGHKVLSAACPRELTQVQ